MPIAATNQAALRIIEELTFGATPATPALKELRYTGESLIHNKETVVSEVIRSDRQRDFLAEVAASAEGDIETEVAFGDELDLLLEGALWGTVTDTDTGSDIGSGEMAVVAASRTFTRSDGGGDFVADGFVPGMWFRTEGFLASSGANNGTFRIETVTTTVITAEAGFGDVGNLVDESPAASTRFFNRRITNGTTARSYTIEKDFNDITQFEVFQGMRFAGMTLTAEVGAIVTATYSLSGRGNVQIDADRANLPTDSATETAADTTEQMNATSNAGQVFEGGAALTTCLNSIALTVENNLRNISCIGDKFPAEVNAGFVDVTGTIEAYFEDEVLFEKFLDHTQSALIFSFMDAAGNEVFVQLPRIFYSSGSPVVPSGNEDILLSMEFTAIRDTSATGTGQTILFDLLPATLP